MEKLKTGELSNIELLSGKGWTGWSEFTKDQMYTFITLRALTASSLMMGRDLPTLDDFSLELITNKDILESNQNGVIGKLVYDVEGVEVWNTIAKKTKGGWIGILNRNDDVKTVSLKQTDMGLIENKSYKLYDVWNEKDVSELDFSINPHAVVFLKY